MPWRFATATTVIADSFSMALAAARSWPCLIIRDGHPGLR